MFHVVYSRLFFCVTIFLLCRTNKVCFAAQKDSVVLIGNFEIEDINQEKSLSFYIFYRNHFDLLSLNYIKSPKFISDNEGCFEIVVHKSILNSHSYFSFENDLFKNFNIVINQDDWDNEVYLNLTSGRTTVSLNKMSTTTRDMPPERIFPLKIVGRPLLYSEEDLSRSRIEDFLPKNL